MTDRDKIELPPLPEHENMTCYGSASMRDYAYTAVLADRERRAEQAQPAGPKVHRARWELCGDGFARRIMLDARTSITNVTICWTADGRVWIESERNRELAATMRSLIPNWFRDATSESLNAVADALDGGVR